MYIYITVKYKRAHLFDSAGAIWPVGRILQHQRRDGALRS